MAIKRIRQRLANGAFGGSVVMAPMPIVAQRAPGNDDLAEIGVVWLDQVGNDIYILLEVVGGAGSWVSMGSGSGSFDSVTSATFINAGTTITAGTGLTVSSGTITATDLSTSGVVTNNASGVLASSTGIDGQVLIDATAAGVPVWANITAGAGIVITDAANSITITATGATSSQYTADDANTIIPDGAGNINIFGNVNCGTTAAIANTITINVDDAPIFAGLVTCQVGISQLAGTATILSNTNAVRAIFLHANGGVSETIDIISSQGTTSKAILLKTTVGGIKMEAGAATANAFDLSTLNAAGGFDLAVGTGGISMVATNGQVDIESGTAAMNVGADAIAHILTLGSATGAAATVLQAGTGNLVVSSTDACTIDTAGVLELNSSGGVISIGNDAVAQNINIGNGAAQRDIVAGNATGTSSFTVNCGTGGCSIGASATAHVTTLGSTNTTCATNINSGSGGIAMTAGGLIDPTPATDTQASPTATSTLNVNIAVATFTGFTTAASTSQTFTITNSLVSASSGILCSASNIGTNDAKLRVSRIKPAAGSFSVTVYNSGSQAVDGDVKISFWVLN